METKYIEIDLSRFYYADSKLRPNSNIEFELVKFYRYKHNEDNDPLLLFTKKLLNTIYIDNKDYDYSEILNFYKEKFYLHTVTSYLSKLTHYILHSIEINGNIKNIIYHDHKITDDEKCIVKFKVTYYKDES